MEKMGFGRKWLNWIKWCISTALFSVLVNGTPSGFFRSSRGLRQGDPLSPYLFVLGMEALSGLIERAVQGGFLSGCYIGRRNGKGMVVSHLLYADDTLLFCRADLEQLAHLIWLLMWFESISGLRINLNKSEIISVGSIAEVDSLALELGCKVGTLPSSYLGLPLGAPHNSVTVWDGFEERFRKRLALWKRQYISKGGRITLIRSTLSSLPIYFMSLFRMPRRVRLRLEQIQRGFLWGGGNLEKKPHLVKWSTVCLDRKMGGLGIKSLAILNKALLCKWIWRFANERDSLWRNVILWKFGEERGGWCSADSRDAYGSGVWKEIRKEWDTVSARAAFSLGNGRRLRFWKDAWSGEEAFSCSYPTLFAMAANKEVSVAEVWEPSCEGGVWTPCFVRPFNDWEMEEIQNLLQTLQEKRILLNQNDLMLMREAKDGCFSVKLFYKVLFGSNSIFFPHQLIWSTWVPTKMSFFAWEASWGKVLTLDQIKKRGRALANRCFLCGNDEETIDHLLLHSPVTRLLWDLLLAIFGVYWVFPKSVSETLISWCGTCVGKRRKKAWMPASLTLFWNIWRERNNIAFENREFSAQRMKALFLCNYWSGTNMFLTNGSRSLIDFLTWLGCK